MNYEKNVNRILNYISSDSQIPKDKLHLLGVSPEGIDKALTELVSKHVPLHKAEEHIKKVWQSSTPATGVTTKDMELMGFVLNDTWKHKITDQQLTIAQVKTMTFKEIETMVMEHPMYKLYQLHKAKFDDNEDKGTPQG